jgi:hypothetical protein
LNSNLRFKNKRKRKQKKKKRETQNATWADTPAVGPSTLSPLHGPARDPVRRHVGPDHPSHAHTDWWDRPAHRAHAHAKCSVSLTGQTHAPVTRYHAPSARQAPPARQLLGSTRFPMWMPRCPVDLSCQSLNNHLADNGELRAPLLHMVCYFAIIKVGCWGPSSSEGPQKHD